MSRLSLSVVWNVAVLIFGLLGCWFSFVLVDHHYNIHISSFILDAVCGVSDQVSSCDVVNRSTASTFLGIPIALLGLFFYGFISLMIVYHLITKELGLLHVILQMAIIGVIIDVGLLIYSLVILDTICKLCLLTYVCTLAVIICSYFAIRQVDSQYRFSFKLDLSWFNRRSNMFGLTFTLSITSLLLSIFIFQSNISSSSSKRATNDPNQLLMDAWKLFKKQYLSSEVVKIPLGNSSFRGAKNPILTIVDFSDFMCPHCRTTAKRLADIEKKYPNAVRVVYKHYPLDKECNNLLKQDFHIGSCKLSYLSYCAGKTKDVFWKVHDALFDKQSQLTISPSFQQKAIINITRQQNVNMASMKSCMTSPTTKQAIVSDIELGNYLHVTGTPAVFINGRKVTGLPIDFFLQQLLRFEAKKLVSSTQQ